MQEEFRGNAVHVALENEDLVAVDSTVSASTIVTHEQEKNKKENLRNTEEVENRNNEDEEEEDELFLSYERHCHQLRVPPPKFSLTQVYCHLFGKAFFYTRL
jgi:hypothetical protein